MAARVWCTRLGDMPLQASTPLQLLCSRRRDQDASGRGLGGRGGGGGREGEGCSVAFTCVTPAMHAAQPAFWKTARIVHQAIAAVSTHVT